MTTESSEVHAARRLADQAASLLGQSSAFQQLAPTTQTAIQRDLSTIQHALHGNLGATYDPYALSLAAPSPRSATADPYALALETPNDLMRRRGIGRSPSSSPPPAELSPTENGSTPAPKVAATEAIAARAGALSDEIDFPAFVANLVHGTFDAIVDASIRQMEAFAGLVSAVAKDIDRFTSENVTPNQVRDWLVEQYPRDLALEFAGGQPRLRRRQPLEEAGEEEPPLWLADYGLEGQELTDELIEQQVVPAARRRYGENRIQMLATMVLMGMNRITVRDGSVSARLRFRAAAKDKAAVDYAVSSDPGSGSNWGGRGSSAQAQSAMMVSTVGVNVQAEADLKAELFGEVKINFVSETLPLERFVDAAQMTLLQRNARTAPPAPSPPSPPALSPPASLAPSSPVTAPSAPAPPAPSPPATPPPSTGGT